MDSSLDSTSFLIWFFFIAAIAGVGLGAMVRAYIGSGSLAVLFREPIALSAGDPVPTLDPDATTQFRQGVEAYQRGKYRQAINRFTQTLQGDAQLAEAYHNRGRAVANLRQDDEAVRSLLKAGELYLEQGNQTGFNQVKRDLEALKARKQARERNL